VVLIHRYVREKHGGAVPVPSYATLRRVWHEWFGLGGTRQRYARTVTVTANGEHVIMHRPGQVVALDTTILPVKLRETVFGDPVSAHLTLALDVYTHSLVAFRLTLVSDTAVDVAMLLRDVMTPLPLREDWGEEMEWAYPGVQAAMVANLAGYRAADPEADAVLTVTEMERLIATWIVKVWQNRRLSEHAQRGTPTAGTARTRCSPRRWRRAGSCRTSRPPSSTTSSCRRIT
jgi:hypothetical protein